MARNEHASNTLQMLREAEREGIEVDEDRVEELEAAVQDSSDRVRDGGGDEA